MAWPLAVGRWALGLHLKACCPTVPFPSSQVYDAGHLVPKNDADVAASVRCVCARRRVRVQSLSGDLQLSTLLPLSVRRLSQLPRSPQPPQSSVCLRVLVISRLTFVRRLHTSRGWVLGWPGGFGLLFALSAAPATLRLATFSRER